MIQNMTPQQQLARVNQLAQQRQLPQALTIAQGINQQHPQFAPAWLSSAILYFQTNQAQKAEQALGKARQLEPENETFAFHEIMMLDAMNRPELALQLAQKLANIPLSDDAMNKSLAYIFEKNEDFKAALRLFKHLSKQQPRHTGWLLKMAQIEQNLGHFAAAEKRCQQVLIIQPGNADALFILSHLKKQTEQNNHIDQLIQLSQQQPASEQAKIYFALAKELEDCQQYAESFTARKKAADIYRQSFQYEIASDLSFMQQIRTDFNAEFMQKNMTGHDTDEPVFIVGLPRSGTTLLDRIITSHSEVMAAGELKQFNRCMLQGLQAMNLNPQLSRTEIVTASTGLDFLKLGEAYLRTSRTRTGHTPHFTDKFPQNSYYVGMILKALPQAKIIIMKRHPIAVCYAVYNQLFNEDSYLYSYDLEEMADYYIEHDKLLSHWQHIGDDRVITVYY
ncbi:MAG: sulfotransferase family protein, partial [Proteobacteria bacterium]